MSQLFQGLFDSDLATVTQVSDFMLCIVFSLILGLIMAFVYIYKSQYTKSFVATLALLPAVVCIVILMVNGNVGTGVAVAGTFSLVRFRSVPGTAKEICAIFLAMATGLIIGMGYIGYACLFVLIMCFCWFIYNWFDFFDNKQSECFKTLTITIPEDLDYTHIFSDIFEEFTYSHKLVQVKTANMGSMYKLTYHVTLKQANQEKQMIDKIRCRNGNLEIVASQQEVLTTQL